MRTAVRAFAAITIGATAARGLPAQVTESQAPSAAFRAATDAITADDIARRISVIAHDSMRGRDTPSRGLELTAQYVAAQFQALGLVPAGDSGGWIQRYALPGHARVDHRQSVLYFLCYMKQGGKPLVDETGNQVTNFAFLDFRTAAIVATDTVLDFRAPGAAGHGQASDAGIELSGPTPVVVAGAHTLESVRRANLQDKVVVYVPEPGSDSTLQRQIVALLHASNHVIVVAADDSVAWAARRQAAEAHPPVALDWYLPEAQHLHRWVVYVRASAIQSALATAGFDLSAEAHNPGDAGATGVAATPIVRELAAFAFLQLMPTDAGADLTAPNTLGLLPGREPGHVIMLTAHMDHTGRRPGQTDSIANGADDNASGVAGVLALAKAFTRAAQAGLQPRRSIVFAAVSGGTKEFWGSSRLIEYWLQCNGPGQIAMNLNLDAIGRAAGDSVWINGLREVELSVRPEWLAASRPELHLTVVDGGSAVAPESDHFAFVRKRIPSLYLHTGAHDADTAASAAAAADTATSIDVAQEARILRLVFALTHELANVPQLPRWTTEGRERRRRFFGE